MTVFRYRRSACSARDKAAAADCVVRQRDYQNLPMKVLSLRHAAVPVLALAILAEAGLSYLGLGTQPPQPSWGRMLADAQTLLYQRPLLAVYPGVCIALAVLGLNFLGDGLRDVLDPKMDVRLR